MKNVIDGTFEIEHVNLFLDLQYSNKSDAKKCFKLFGVIHQFNEMLREDGKNEKINWKSIIKYFEGEKSNFKIFLDIIYKNYMSMINYPNSIREIKMYLINYVYL